MLNLTSFPAVELTLWLLGAFSVATWALILIKGTQYVRAARSNAKYAKQFWAAANLQSAAEIASTGSSLSRVAASGFAALRSPTHDGPGHKGSEHDLEHSWDHHELLDRNLRQQIKRERRSLDAGAAVLASIGSTAPFVGLFGTVWGIMHAMSDIGKLGNASIDVVAGPIGEALIATGIGIAVAIPAVLAYNFFVRRLKSVVADLEDFAHDFLNLAQRATYRIETGGRPLDLHRERHDGKRGERAREFDRAPAVAGS
jgi:biopolymer transport protein ExbB